MGRDVDAEYNDLLEELQVLADEDDPQRLHADRVRVIRLRMAQLQRDHKMGMQSNLGKPVVALGGSNAGRPKGRTFSWFTDKILIIAVLIAVGAVLVVGLWLLAEGFP